MVYIIDNSLEILGIIVGIACFIVGIRRLFRGPIKKGRALPGVLGFLMVVMPTLGLLVWIAVFPFGLPHSEYFVLGGLVAVLIGPITAGIVSIVAPKGFKKPFLIGVSSTVLGALIPYFINRWVESADLFK